MYSRCSFAVFVLLGPWFGAAFSASSVNPGYMIAGLALGIMFWPLTLFGGLPSAFVAWLIGMGLSKGLGAMLVKRRPGLLILPSDSSPASFRSKELQAIVGAVIGITSGVLAYLVMRHTVVYGHVIGKDASLHFLCTHALTGLTCGFFSAIVAYSKTAKSQPR